MLKKFVGRYAGVDKAYKISGFGKCFQKCVDVLKEYEKMFRTTESIYDFVLKDLTSMGDSTFKQSEVPDEGKRVVRHVNIDKDTYSIHLVRIGLAKSFMKDLMNCIVKDCREDVNIGEILDIMKKFIERISDSMFKDFLLREFNNWCREYNIC